MRSTWALLLSAVSVIVMLGGAPVAVCQHDPSKNPIVVAPDVAVGAQYDSTDVYVTLEDSARVVSSVVATFSGTTSKQVVTTVTHSQQHAFANHTDVLSSSVNRLVQITHQVAGSFRAERVRDRGFVAENREDAYRRRRDMKSPTSPTHLEKRKRLEYKS